MFSTAFGPKNEPPGPVAAGLSAGRSPYLRTTRCCPVPFDPTATLWWTNKKQWKITIFNGTIHYKWSFSIAVCMFTRGYQTFASTDAVDRLPGAEEQSSCRESLPCISVCFPVFNRVIQRQGKISMIALFFSPWSCRVFCKPSHPFEEDILFYPRLSAPGCYGSCSMIESIMWVKHGKTMP